MKPGIDVVVREVGLRDGIQNISVFMATADKLEWLAAEAAAGMPEMEVCSFVPVKVIPQFSDANEVVAHALRIDGLTVSALIPNLKGAERGITAGVHKLNFVMSVSASHNLANVRRTREESLADFASIARMIKGLDSAKRPMLAGGLSTALGCTIEGQIREQEVVRCAAGLAEAGAEEIIVADTVGYADPMSVRRVFKAVQDAVKPLPVAAHFHDTRGLGLANALAALDSGVTQFDACLAGLGGCPFAPGASGNIVMEDLVFMLEGMGLRTGVDIEQMIAVRAILERSLPRVALQGAIAKAKLPKGFYGRRPAAAE
ncbi:MAG TPA: hydroxymethylglutaryl-CoA lyase [Xanthobacteraceae bacterium]